MSKDEGINYDEEGEKGSINEKLIVPLRALWS